MKLTLHSFDLELNNTFTTAHSQRDVQETVIVSLSHLGKTGFGEATANSYFNVSRSDLIASIQQLSQWVENQSPDHPFSFYTELSLKTSNRFVRCALDQAMHDLHGKITNQTTMAALGIPQEMIPLTDFTIGLSELDHMLEKLRNRPWPIYKIKLNDKLEIDVIKAIRKETNAKLRVDANCAWTADQTINYSEKLLELGVELIEQPLPRQHWKEMQEVYKYSALPIIADESCEVPTDIDRCKDHFHGVNIKLTKCGGITPAFGMIQHARRLKMSVMVGCMTESSVGISAAAQLAPFTNYVDLDGALLIKNDPATGITMNDGTLVYPKQFGNGVNLISNL